MPDWNDFEADARAALLASGRRLRRNIGYVVWSHALWESLSDPELPRLLATDLTHATDGYLRALHTTKQTVSRSAETLARRGFSRVRTGASLWEYSMPSGPAWITWCLKEYSRRGFDILLDFAFPPPALTVEGKMRGPLKEPAACLALAARAIEQYRPLLGMHVECLNEWDLDWLPALDPGLAQLTAYVAAFAQVAHGHGMRVVLGGPAKSFATSNALVDLEKFAARGLFRYVDVAGFHNVRGTKGDWCPCPPLTEQVAHLESRICARRPDHRWLANAAGALLAELPRSVRRSSTLRPADAATPVWLTEYGFPPVVLDDDIAHSEGELEEIQVALFAYQAILVLTGRLDRAYWHTIADTDVSVPSVRLHDTGWEDFLQHHQGDTRVDGSRRLLGNLLEEGGVDRVVRYALEHHLFSRGLIDAASLNRMQPDAYHASIAGTQ